MGAFVLAALEMGSDKGAFVPVAPTVNHCGSASAPAALEMVSDRGASASVAAVGKFSARFSLLLAGV